MTETKVAERRRDPRRPVTMLEAVGYPAIDCSHEVLAERRLVLKHDRLFLLTDPHGNVTPPGVCSLGLFHDDTRILSHYQLEVRGGTPQLLSAQVPTPFRAQIDLAVNDLPFGGSHWDPHNVIHIRRELLVEDRLVERLTLASFLRRPIDYWVEVTFGCDFADIFEVRGWRRDSRGQFYAPEHRGDALVFSYRGRDDRVMRSVIRFQRPPDRLDGLTAHWELPLRADRVELQWEVHAAGGPVRRAFPRTDFDRCRARLDRDYRAWRDGCSRWYTSVADCDHLLARATDDLRALQVEVDGDTVLSAGIPWYCTVFGRDSLLTSLETLPLQPRIAVETLRYLAGRQGEREQEFTEEQPGKILHELRRGELARSGEIPHVPYYGSVDATPLWLILLHETWRWTGDERLVRDLLPNAVRALEWIDRYGDLDGDGLVEYARTSDRGLVNQGWKDSGDGVPFPDGRLPEPPIALVEVQGYVHDAKVRMAELFESVGDAGRGERLRREAAALKERIRQVFWLEELGTFALALDREKRPLPTATTNAGHLLWSRVPIAKEGEQVIEGLLSPDFFSGWGIRTLSAAHPVYNPMSYHNGSVWPHDNAIVVLGMALYGRARAALPVVTALYEAGLHQEMRRLPELFCGMPRRGGLRPVDYPVSCSPQAWASGSLFLLLQAMLGLYAEAPRGVLHVRDPVLPAFLDELTVRNLAIGESRVALQFRRHGSRTLANLLSVEGERLQVRIELS